MPSIFQFSQCSGNLKRAFQSGLFVFLVIWASFANAQQEQLALQTSSQSERGTSEEADDILLPAMQAQAPERVQSADLPELEETTQPNILRVGLVAGRGAAYLQARIEPFRKYLVSTLQRPVEIIAFPTAQALVMAHISKQIDYAHYPASAFAQAYASCGCVQPLVAPLLENGQPGTYMILVVKQDRNIKTLADLTGKTLVLSSTKAAVPYHMALNELRQDGLDPATDLATILAEENPLKALERLFKDEADAALVWSSTPYNHSLLTSAGAVSSYVNSLKSKKNKKVIGTPDFITIWQSRPVPPSPHAVHNDMSKQDRAQLTTILKAMIKDAPDAYDAIERHHAGGYRSVSLDDYAPLLDIATSQ